MGVFGVAERALDSLSLTHRTAKYEALFCLQPRFAEKEKFSKKQWQAKQQRRCKECIADNREVNLGAPNDGPPFPGADGDEGALRLRDEDLFKQPPARDECPICMLTLPIHYADSGYRACCGKIFCNGCMHAIQTEGNRELCPFCRSPGITSDQYIERIKKRVEGGDDAAAIYQLGCDYYLGEHGLRQNFKKANKLWLRAGELGLAVAYCKIGYAYYNGQGVEKDAK